MWSASTVRYRVRWCERPVIPLFFRHSGRLKNPYCVNTFLNFPLTVIFLFRQITLVKMCFRRKFTIFKKYVCMIVQLGFNMLANVRTNEDRNPHQILFVDTIPNLRRNNVIFRKCMVSIAESNYDYSLKMFIFNKLSLCFEL